MDATHLVLLQQIAPLLTILVAQLAEEDTACTMLQAHLSARPLVPLDSMEMALHVKIVMMFAVPALDQVASSSLKNVRLATLESL